MSLFEHIPKSVPSGTYAAFVALKNDTDEKAVNLAPGVYHDDNGKTWVLPSVKRARTILATDPNLKHDILPQLGHAGFIAVARELSFGETLDGRVVTSIQTIAGTGANHFIARFASDHLHPKSVWFPDPTWDNHPEIWKIVNPTIKQHYYPYANLETFTIDIRGLVTTLREKASKGDAVVLQACAHNPTGLDPSKEQWEAIANVCEEKGLFPIFDSAYQGFATGDLDEDAWAIRHFATRSRGTIEFAVAQSFSKNFGLYGERVGALHIVSRDSDAAVRVEGALQTVYRAEITASPGFGAKIVSTIFQTPDLKRQWQQDLKTMSGRLKYMRRRLYDELSKRSTPGNWDHLLTDGCLKSKSRS
ncbi:aspartate aminotransferase [Niveomyces insectorum RCEF 264]|uniref:Aspartate aminotransferase n=1 Tax=Niveomyces insectorum RCEF 264 TaxID=1081102 RepID=A0A167YTY1_9HYPO|nr:aspartate aminotransferase [Niveomyces insectorum RCEF 264]